MKEIKNMRKAALLKNDWFDKLLHIIKDTKISTDEWIELSIHFARTLSVMFEEEAKIMMLSVMSSLSDHLFLMLFGNHSREENIKYYKSRSEWEKLYIVILYGFVSSWESIRQKIKDHETVDLRSNNQKEKEPDWAKTEPLGPLKVFCEKCGKEITSKSDEFQKLNNEKEYNYFCKKCYYEKEGE